MDWPLQDVKNRFSEVVRRARREGPQTVTLRGEPAVVVLSAADYDALVRDRPSLVDDLLSGPAWDDALVDAVDARAKSPSRDSVI
jgi:prevent-host-death family protein